MTQPDSRNQNLATIDWDDPEQRAEAERIMAERKERKAVRRSQAEKEFEAAQLEAENHGMRLRRFSDLHYAIEFPGKWRIEIYPGNQRLYRQSKKMSPPFIRVRKNPWGLIDVVKAAAAAMKEKE